MKSSVAKYKSFEPTEFAHLESVVKAPMTIQQIMGKMYGKDSNSITRALCFRAVLNPLIMIDVATPLINSNIYAEAETNGSSYVFFPSNWRRQNVLKLQHTEAPLRDHRLKYFPDLPADKLEIAKIPDDPAAIADEARRAIRAPTGRERLSSACVAYMQTTGRVAYYLDHVLKVDINGLTVEFRASPGESLRIMKSLLRGIKNES